jgi:hypothetical protein
MSRSGPFALPRLKEVFEALRRGRHLCPEDGELYWALRDNLEPFQDLFAHLGFRLEFHPRDFFYFRGEGGLSDASARMALFMFILIEALGDTGAAVEESVMTRTFSVNDLPHHGSERYQAYLKEAGVDGDEGMESILRNLERFGFAKRTGSNFRFRSPVYRFLDLCHEVLAQSGTGEEETAP